LQQHKDGSSAGLKPLINGSSGVGLKPLTTGSGAHLEPHRAVSGAKLLRINLLSTAASYIWSVWNFPIVQFNMISSFFGSMKNFMNLGYGIHIPFWT